MPFKDELYQAVSKSWCIIMNDHADAWQTLCNLPADEQKNLAITIHHEWQAADADISLVLRSLIKARLAAGLIIENDFIAVLLQHFICFYDNSKLLKPDQVFHYQPHVTIAELFTELEKIIVDSGDEDALAQLGSEILVSVFYPFFENRGSNTPRNQISMTRLKGVAKDPAFCLRFMARLTGNEDKPLATGKTTLAVSSSRFTLFEAPPTPVDAKVHSARTSMLDDKALPGSMSLPRKSRGWDKCNIL
jgi:hypothetical protein